jgi:hypothetical protein
MLLLSEARQFLADSEGGIEFVAEVHRSVQDVMNGLVLDTVRSLTLSSDEGGIPVTVSNDADETLSFSVRLSSESFRAQPSADLELAPGDSETISLRAEIAAGQSLIDVQLLSPNGRVIEQDTIVVRSTGYNRIALLITIGAAILMVGVWARRFFRRPTP